MDLDFDGVPLPVDVIPLDPSAVPGAIDPVWSGVWIGRWGTWLKTVLIIEAVSDTGAVSAIYAIGANPSQGFNASWSRCGGQVRGNCLHLAGGRISATYEARPNGRLKAIYGDGEAHAILRHVTVETLRGDSALHRWLGGEQVFLDTDPDGTGQAVRLECILYKPDGDGPFPLAAFNHGSTGEGTDPTIARQTRADAGLAEYLTERGWLVAFPQRRGRGQSDGIYDEGFGDDRSQGYTDDPERSLAGAERALTDLAAAVQALKDRRDVSDAPILIAGQSRGGILSVAYAGRHPEAVAGVINFVGGWIGDLTPNAPAINGRLFGSGAGYPRRSLWLYGEGDIFYSLDHCRENHTRFTKQGGTADFHAIQPRHPGTGHYILEYPPLWEDLVSAYLDSELPGTAR